MGVRPLHENMSDSLDLRRRRTRELAEVVVDHARWSLPDDRAVLCAIYRDGMKATDVARLRRESARGLRGRIRRLVGRLLSDRFYFVVRHMDEWPAERGRVARACVLEGRSMREAGRHLHVSLHFVRREMGIVEGLYETEKYVAEHRGAKGYPSLMGRGPTGE